VQEGAASPTGAINGFLRQVLEVVAIVSGVVPDHVHQSSPAASQPDDTMALTDGSKRDCPDRGVQPWYIAAASEKPDRARLRAHPEFLLKILESMPPDFLG
jgi:hypothetical protein